MSLLSLNTSGYISCIKIFGYPILPPLMTEERRKEVNEDRARAILIEQRKHKKRNSVDSGVMTGSYIDNGKSQNSEGESAHGKCDIECHECKHSPSINVTAIKDFLNNNYTHSENSNFSNNSTSNYSFKPVVPVNSILNTGNRTSSENNDQAADKICSQKNNIINSCEHLCKILSDNQNKNIVEAASFNDIKQDCHAIISSNTKDLETTLLHQTEYSNKENNDLLDIIVCQNPELTSSKCDNKSGNDICQLKAVSNDSEISEITSKENTETNPQTPKNIIRRNSYTLESPSPVLLEHLMLQEKQKTFIKSTTAVNTTTNTATTITALSATPNNNNNNINANKTRNISSSLNKTNLFPSFKSVRSSTKKRRVWNKTEAKAYWTNHLNSQDIRLTKSVTSIPSSTQMSPVNVGFHSLSLESLTITSNISEFIEGCHRRHSNVSCQSEPTPVNYLSAESFNKINSTDLKIHINSGVEYNQRVLTNNLCQFENTDSETKSDSVDLAKNEESCISDFLPFKDSNECNNHFTEKAILAHNHLLSMRNKQLYNSSSAVIYQDSICPDKCTTEHSEDSVSFCSTGSLNQQDNLHQQQEIMTSEESVCLMALKLRHEQEIKKLLQKQQAEVRQLSVKSNNQSLPPTSSDSVSDSSVIRLSSAQSNHTCCTEMSLDVSGKSERRLCNRQLFPKSSGYSKKEIRAATIINAYARGFLTRRLLRTERVCQIIETIRESLVCALEMRNEQQLELKDLQLHDRLIQQLTHGCHELHNIFSLPAAERMAIIAADREKEQRKLTSNFKTPTVSSATRRSMLRKQNNRMSVQNMTSTKLYENNRKIRSRTSSSGGTSDTSVCSSRSRMSMKSQQPQSPCLSRKPWR